MDQLFEFLLGQAQYAHFYIFGLFMLAGLNIPVSEDILIIAGAIASANFVPENTNILFAACFLGAFISDIICYGLGRGLGPRLTTIKPFKYLIDQPKLEMMQNFYGRYGALTLFFGRFIPFGVRNAIFLTSGMSRMNFAKFCLIDGIACSITTTILFSLGRMFAKNYQELFGYLADSKWIIAAVAAFALGIIFVVKKRKKSLV